jgi:hypothetical protein
MNLVRKRLLNSAAASLTVAIVVLIAAIAASSASGSGAKPSHQRSLTAAQMAQLTRRAERYGVLARQLIARRDTRFRVAHRVVHAGAAPDPGAMAAIRDVAIRMSSLNGVATPTGGMVFSSSHKIAETVLTGDTVMDDVPVFAVVVHGSFIGFMAHTASGAFPTGTTLTITFDANTLEVTDWSLVHIMPGNLGSLGISTALGS